MKYHINLTYGLMDGIPTNLLWLDCEYFDLLEVAYDGCSLGWMTIEELNEYIYKAQSEPRYIFADCLNRMMIGENVLSELIEYYVNALKIAIKSEGLPMVQFSELHDYCDANVLLDDVLGNPYENDGLETSVYWGNLVSDAYNRTLQG